MVPKCAKLHTCDATYGDGGMRTEDRAAELLQLGAQVFAQLPSDPADATVVLHNAQWLVDNYLHRPAGWPRAHVLFGGRPDSFEGTG